MFRFQIKYTVAAIAPARKTQLRPNAAPPTGDMRDCGGDFDFGVCFDIGVGVGVGAPGPHKGPPRVGFVKFRGRQPWSSVGRAPQFSSMLLQHQSPRVSREALRFQRRFKGAHWGHRRLHSQPAYCRVGRCSWSAPGPSRCCGSVLVWSELRPAVGGVGGGGGNTLRMARSTRKLKTLGSLHIRRRKLQLPDCQSGRKQHPPTGQLLTTAVYSAVIGHTRRHVGYHRAGHLIARGRLKDKRPRNSEKGGSTMIYTSKTAEKDAIISISSS